MKSKFIILTLSLCVLAGGAYAIAKGKIDPELFSAEKKEQTAPAPKVSAPAISVAKVHIENFVDSVFVTGTLIAKDEILVAPEVEGLRVLELKVDLGDRVEKGQVLALLERETLEVQLAQNTAALTRSKAAIAQANSQLSETQARVKEAEAQLRRARPLKKKGFLSGRTFDQRSLAARAAKAQLAAARDGIAVAEAELAQQQAQRRDIEWRLSRTEVKAPTAGVIARKTTRVGSMATASGEPMFRIIQDGEIELDGEVTETQLAKIHSGLKAQVTIAGIGAVEGRVRLVSPEVNRETRLGNVRISLDQNDKLRIGSFARGTIKTSTSRGLAVPAAAVMYNAAQAGQKTVLRVKADTVEQRTITTGLQTPDWVEVTSGLSEGDLVVSKAGTFLRDGDRIKPIMPASKVSEAR